MNQKQAKLEQMWKEFDKQQKQIAKLEDFVARNIVRASTTKRAQSRRKQLEKWMCLVARKVMKKQRILVSNLKTNG